MRRLYVRLFFWFCVANVLTLLISVFVTEHIVRARFEAEAEQHAGEMDAAWRALAREAIGRYTAGGAQDLRDWAAHFRQIRLFVDLYDADGHAQLHRFVPPPLGAHLQELLAADERVLRPYPGVTIAAVAVPGPDGRPWHFVALRGPPRPPPRHFLTGLEVEITVSLLVIAVIGWLVTRDIAAPVTAVQRAARRMAEGDLSARVGAGIGGADELGQLAQDFDFMAERIESLVTRSRSLLQDVSHELRSPLARLQVALGLARREAPAESQAHFDRAEREVMRLDRLIGEVLALARMEGRLPGMEMERLDLEELVRDCIEEFQPDLEAAGQEAVLANAAGEKITVNGNRELLARAVENVLSNAIKFGPRGGKIGIELGRAANDISIAVCDSGPGVLEHELGDLFRPFFRGSNATQTEGHGLGLSIVERIVAAHGGSVGACSREGGGLCVTLRFPNAATASRTSPP